MLTLILILTLAFVIFWSIVAWTIDFLCEIWMTMTDDDYRKWRRQRH